jgi:hypothetical protein
MSVDDTVPEIHAVVEVAVRERLDWLELPAEPWPRFVRLCRATTDDEIALLVATLASYGHGGEAPASAQTLADDFPVVAPGGFAVVGRNRAVWPSCCCGLETAASWSKILHGGGSPWMGHDPSPLIEVLDGHVYAWTDGALGAERPAEEPLVFTSSQFATALNGAMADLNEVLIPLTAWLRIHAAKHSKRIAHKFRETFVLPLSAR